jgi:hypothetical protein
MRVLVLRFLVLKLRFLWFSPWSGVQNFLKNGGNFFTDILLVEAPGDNLVETVKSTGRDEEDVGRVDLGPML